MLAVLLTWCYIFVAGFNLGFAVNKILRLQLTDFVVSIFLGLFSVTLVAGFWAVFDRIHLEFHVFLLLLNLAIFWYWKNEIISSYHAFYLQIINLPRQTKLMLVVTSILLLAVSAAPANFTDNETYYIQTIKWLNTYGFVKGLANLHIFFGQTSGWHILQSAFNLSFLDLGLNRINGFCVLMATIHGSLKMVTFKQAGLLPLVLVCLFPFIGVPSPDLAVCVIAFICFCYFLEHFDDCSLEAWTVILLLAVFIVLIKVTALPILLLPLVLLFRRFGKVSRHILVGCFLAFATLILFVLKNTILTGLPLFPLNYFSSVANLDFAIPKPIYQLLFNDARLYDFVMPKSDYYKAAVMEVFIKWLSAPGFSGFFNCFTILLLFTIPIFIGKCLNKKAYWVLYGLMIVQLAFLFMTSPQYRFMLPFIFFFSTFIIARFVPKNLILKLQQLSVLIFIVLLISPAKNAFSNRQIQFENDSIEPSNLIIPHSNSNLSSDFQAAVSGNLYYNSPQNHYFWVTGDGKLPCVNTTQLQYFQRKTGYRPQQRTSNLKDGFYSQKISP